MRKNLAYLGLGVMAVSGVFFFFHDPGYFWIEAQFLLEISLLTLITRSFGFFDGWALWGTGVAVSTALILLVGNVLMALGIQIHGIVAGAIILPLAEELAKLLPVLLFAWWVEKKKKIRLNPSDFLFLSVFCAAGFSMLEKYYWQNVSFPATLGPQLGGFHLFPDALAIRAGGAEMGFIGHAAATGLVGLGLGLGLAVKSQKWGRGWWWGLPLATLAWVTLEHQLNNLYYVSGSTWLRFMGGGRLTPWLFLFLALGAVAFDLWQLRSTIRSSPILLRRRGLFGFCLKKSWREKRIPSVTFFCLLFGQLRLGNMITWSHYQRRSHG